MSKRSKLSRKKNYAQLDIFPSNNASKPADRLNSTGTTVKNDSSLESFPQILRQHLPSFDGNWENFPEFPRAQQYRKYNLTEKTENKLDRFTKSAMSNEDITSHDVEMQDLNSDSTAECNRIIEQCPLCPLRFPIAWSQRQIQMHVNEHID